MLTDVADYSRRGTSERIREKMVKMSQMAQSAAAARPVDVTGRDKVVRDLEERVREAEMRVSAGIAYIYRAGSRGGVEGPLFVPKLLNENAI